MRVTTCSGTTRSAGIILKNWFINSKNVAKGQDFALLASVLSLVIFGLLMVFSASFIFAQERTGDGFAFIKRQLLHAMIGFFALWVARRIDYRRWMDWAYPLLIAVTVLLVLVMIPGLGAKVGGAQRWLSIGGIHFQPGELFKFSVVVFVARQLWTKRDRLQRLSAGVLSSLIVPLPAFILLLFQPDFGSAAMVVLVMFLMMFLAGVPKRYLLGAVVVAAAVGSWLVLGTPYRRARIVTFLDPWSDPGGKGFQILQSLLGLHHGGAIGVGLGNGKEKLFYLPEAHNDFIFAVIGEELGFAGVCLVIFGYLFFVYYGLKIAWSCRERYSDGFGMLLATGITLALGLQALINMAVVLGLLPTKGLALPFVSYGGSALVVDLFAVGVLLSVARGPGKAQEAQR